MRIGCDLDNVLVDIIEAARVTLADDHEIPLDSIRHTGIYWDPFTHDDPNIAAALKTPSIEFWDRPEVLRGSQPLPGAFDAAWRLHGLGLLACYITRRPEHVADLTHAWLIDHGFPQVPVEHVGLAGSADYFERCKSTVCHRYGVTHMFDDHPGEAELLSKAGVEVVLIDAAIGRAARNEFLESHPHLRLAADVTAAADMMIAEKAAAYA